MVCIAVTYGRVVVGGWGGVWEGGAGWMGRCQLGGGCQVTGILLNSLFRKQQLGFLVFFISAAKERLMVNSLAPLHSTQESYWTL